MASGYGGSGMDAWGRRVGMQGGTGAGRHGDGRHGGAMWAGGQFLKWRCQSFDLSSRPTRAMSIA